jgi:restriction endonuclease S subunit
MVSVLSRLPLALIVEGQQLAKRRDVSYYHPKYFKASEELERSPWEIRTLGEISESIKDGPGGWVFHASQYVQEGIPMLRVLNIREEGLSLDNLVFITEETHKKLKRSAVLPGDVLLSMRGTIGLATVCPGAISEANINAALARIRLKKDVNPYYVAAFLNSKLGRAQTERGGFKAVQSDLNLSIIKSIRIPIPPGKIQDQIADIMDAAYRLKNTKQVEIESICNSIENHIIAELGIRVTQPSAEKHFAVSFDEIKGKRVDPYYHHPSHKELEQALTEGLYLLVDLGNVIKSANKGTLPKSQEKEGTVKVLQIRNITPWGDLDLSDILMAKTSYAQEHPEAKLEADDLIVVMTGATIGKVALFDSKNEFYLGGDMIRMTMQENKCVPMFVFAVLLSTIGQRQIVKHTTGATNKHLSVQDLLKVKIPLAPLSIQETMAMELHALRKRRRRLGEEVNEVQEKAKQQVEDILTSG